MIAVTLELVIFMYQIDKIKMNKTEELSREQIELIKEEYYINQLPTQL